MIKFIHSKAKTTYIFYKERENPAYSNEFYHLKEIKKKFKGLFLIKIT